ncbi:squalene monooxygenase-like [Pyrus ussuriensis x Pyrus communis]|uniref:Squalene monooxygenase n=1 Tax=Pyrus ussuriensis x Pyrus communis TaxID=2448454 RepID=A0A5N5FQ01_9ROSA|nr:squalene monooxygenase-like [Pyrus ussuriensis x Pyrus communis]
MIINTTLSGEKKKVVEKVSDGIKGNGYGRCHCWCRTCRCCPCLDSWEDSSTSRSTIILGGENSLFPGGYLKLIELGLEGGRTTSWLDDMYGVARNFRGAASGEPASPTSLGLSGDNSLSPPIPLLGRPSEGTSAAPSSKPLSGDLSAEDNGLFGRVDSLIISFVTLEQGTVTTLIEEKGTIKGVTYKNKAGEEMRSYAPLTIVCDGCFQISAAISVLQSSTEVRCLVDVPGTKVPSVANGEMAKYLKTVVALQVPPQLLKSFLVAVEKGNIRTMQNKSMSATPGPTPGAILLGDAFNMRHPLTGGGMTVVLSDIVLLRDLLRPLSDLNDAPALCEYLESFYTLRKPVSSTINTLAGALYKGASGIIFPIIKDEGVRQMFFPATIPGY